MVTFINSLSFSLSLSLSLSPPPPPSSSLYYRMSWTYQSLPGDNFTRNNPGSGGGEGNRDISDELVSFCPTHGGLKE
jgi:hypothetical protein